MEDLKICLMLEVKTESVAEGGLMSRRRDELKTVYIFF
jgi:hypothetical protein